MAVWTKRTIKSPTRGIRQTKTNSYGGKKVSKSTLSSSYVSGSTRVTRSVSSDGKLRKTITEHRPNGYSRRTTQTLVPANKPKVKKSSFPKQRKLKITTKTRNSSTRSARSYESSSDSGIYVYKALANDPGSLLLLCLVIAFLTLFVYSVKLALFAFIGLILIVIGVYAWPNSEAEEVEEKKDNSWKWWAALCALVWGFNYTFFTW